MACHGGSPARRVAVLAGALLSSCATASAEKGGLVPLDLPRDEVAAAHEPRRLALLVGVGRFEEPGWRPLRYPEKDVADLARVLRDPQKGAFGQVETLTGGATREAILLALQRLGEIDRDERDTVVVYLSSHGTLARDARGALRRYLVARDTRLEDIAGTALAMDDLKAAFDRLRSRRKALVLATCHSGGGKSLLPQEVQRELAGTKAGFFVRPIEEVSRASVVLAACDWGETAREDEELGNDIYTHYLVEALQLGADRNGDGAVTASEAHDYARRMTYEHTGGRQRPTAESSEVGADPIVLVGRVVRRGRPELYSYAPALDGFTVRVDGRPLADLPGGVALDPGRHRLQVQKGAGPFALDMPLSLGPGDRVDLEELIARSDRRWDLGLRVTFMGFLDARDRRELLAPVLGAGAVATLRDWPGRRMSLRLDASASSGRQIYSEAGFRAPFDYTAFTLGAGIAWRFPLAFAPEVVLSAGPRLSLVFLARRFGLDLARGPQSYLVTTPGLLLGVGYEAGSRLTLGLESQLDWMLMRVDGRSRSTGFGQVLLGAGWRF